MLIDSVTALYVDPRGPYPSLLVDWYDEARDARNYAGPNPVIAHPACGPWGCLSHQYKGSEGGPELAVHAIGQVRTFGGVLEHPAHSRLFRTYGLPLPWQSDAYGFTITINQVDWGHVAPKATWLYICGVEPELLPGAPPNGIATHWISGGGAKHDKRIKLCGAAQRRRTPVAFAKWLITIASRARGLYAPSIPE
jgi:hypothetical protein